MKQMSEIAEKAMGQEYLGQTIQAGREYTESDKKFINGLFDEMAGTFPAWQQAFDGPDTVRNAKRVWLRALVDNHITTVEQISRGLKRAAQEPSDFFPSVGKFIEWCKPDPNELKEYIVPKALDNPTKPETFNEHINAMKELLND